MIAPKVNPAKPPSAAPGIYAAIARALAPRKPLTVSLWADEVQIRANLQDNFAHALESASQHFARLAAGSKA